jgi:hypothetical protein
LGDQPPRFSAIGNAEIGLVERRTASFITSPQVLCFRAERWKNGRFAVGDDAVVDRCISRYGSMSVTPRFARREIPGCRFRPNAIRFAAVLSRLFL